MLKLSYIVVSDPESFGSFEAFAAVLRRLKELGYEGVEVGLTGPAGHELDALHELTQSIDLPVVSFLTGTNYFRDGLCLSSPDGERRTRAVERLCSHAAIAARFDAILVVGQMQGFSSDEPDRSLALERIETSLETVVRAAEQNGVTVVLEPVNHLQCGFNNTLDEVMAVTRSIGSAHLKPMLDSLHMNIEETSLIEPIHRVGPDLGHFHLCESNGGLFGSGNLPFSDVLQALESVDYQRYTSIKVYREAWDVGAASALEYLRSRQGAL